MESKKEKKEKNVWKRYTEAQRAEAETFARDYMDFLSKGKTERECVQEAVAAAQAAGFRDICACDTLKPGDRVWVNHMGKSFMAFIVGSQPLERGMNILGAHIDSPRIDVKSNPLYEDNELAYLDTHYYGGIKKYQWVTIPLALHGVVIKKSGEKIEWRIGEDEADPVFCISDLLPHLAREQMNQNAAKIITGEGLDLLIGSRPLTEDAQEDGTKGPAAGCDAAGGGADGTGQQAAATGADGASQQAAAISAEQAAAKDTEQAAAKGAEKDAGKDAEKKAREKDAVKANILALLKEAYDIEEEDFLSAELEIVPAGRARDMGLDRSMILGYGHDDRVCAYPSLRAVLDYEGTPERTLCCILTDKEEIGSYGATGMDSRFFENTVAEVLARVDTYSELTMRRALRNSFMLSSDVSAGFDPLFASVYEPKNAAFLGRGMCFNKFTGSGGKGSSSDANPEFIAQLRAVLDDSQVSYQFSELGKVDQGGGGTIAELCAKYCMNVIDAGVAVLSMHAPYEVVSKVDVYEAYRGYCAFLQGIQ